MDRELNPKQQTSEAIRAAESILIITGQNPTVDQVTSVVALGEILRKLGKKTNTLVSDSIPSGARFVTDGKVDRQMEGLRDFVMQLNLANSEVDKLKYTIEDGKLNVHITPFRGGFNPSDVTFAYGDYQYDLVVVIGVATYSRIEKLYQQNSELFKDVPLVNIDFHRVNENYGAINLIDTNAASLSEMLVALAESLQTGIIDEPIATLLLTGIMASTDRFTANHTSAKALTVAAQMVALGANHQKVVTGLYQSKPKQDRPRQEQPRQEQTRPAVPQEQPKQEQSFDSAQDKPAPKAAEVTNSQPHKQIIAGGVLQRSETQTAPVEAQPEPVEAQPAAQEPVQRSQPTPEPFDSVQDRPAPRPDNVIEMLPPSHIEISEDAQLPEVHPQQVSLSTEPEPLINDAETPQPQKPNPETNPLENTPDPKVRKGVNPANNPLYVTR